jgi:ATP-dependent DNA helicase RecG
MRALEKLFKPLSFILRNPERALRQVRGLERFVNHTVEEAIKECRYPEAKALFEEIRVQFKDFDTKGLTEKKEVLLKAKSIMEEIEDLLKTSELDVWDIPIREVKGVGPKIARLLEKKGIKTVWDALMNLPLRYENRKDLKKFFQIKPGEWVTAFGQVLKVEEVTYPKSSKKVLEVLLSDGTGFILAKWFQGWDYLKRILKVGTKLMFSGEIKGYFEQKEIHHPDIEIIQEDKEQSLHFGRIVPIYSQTENLKQRRMRSLMYKIVNEYATRAKTCVPLEIEVGLDLPSFSESILEIHFPSSSKYLRELTDRTSPYHKRLAFEELFLLEVGIALRKEGLKRTPGIILNTTDLKMLDQFIQALPFSLTQAQKKAIEEIKADLSKPHPMYRLLQGDVGSGKTVVALCGALIAIENGYQAAIMAPTEILAEQHFETVLNLTKGLPLKVALLTSKIRGSEREKALRDISEGRIQIIVGTHALIQEGVSFKALGFAVIDEQHRFGVIQRGRLYQKGPNPHLLVMTATPIPRTLALTLYGDMEISILDEMPEGRSTIETHIFRENERERAYQILEEEVKKGHQGYVVYPLIEGSEETDTKNVKEGFRELKRKYPQWRIGLLHGKMRPQEKERIMRDFKENKIQVLVSTTVIEVGIDVPNATVMLVEEAQRFGLAQLHQLRGRVGRGPYPSYCLLVARGQLSEEAEKRLNFMKENRDGFKIAEADLILRGPGEILGTKQWGIPKFKVVELPRDLELFFLARREAFKLVQQDPTLQRHKALRDIVIKRLGERLTFVNIG